MARLELRLLGSPSVGLDGAPVEGFAFQKARALLYFLLKESHQPHAREALVGLLWPDMPEATARTNLRQALANLREAIGDEQAQPPFLSIRRDSLQFNEVSDHWTDVGEFTRLLDACKGHVHRHPDRCRACARRQEQAIHLYRRDFLAGFHLKEADPFEEWAAIQRERLHRRMAGALVRQANFYEATGELEHALSMLGRQLDLDPWMEEAHRERMRLLATVGRRSEALAQYEACRRVLSEELGVAPAPETVRLQAQILDGNLPGPAAAKVEAPRPLPLPAAPLIGRQRELAELADRLEDPGHRLVTLMGGSGVGKSRLALAAAQQVRSSFTGGVAFVPAETLDKAEQIPTAILAALAIDPAGPADPGEQLLEALRDRELLLVLDSLEHLLPAARALLMSLLENARKLSILVTSQERLGLQAEWCYEVEGLEVAPQSPQPGIQHVESVELFLERGRRINRRLGAEGRELADVHRICRLVEGIPLAIELAASAVDTRTCQEIAEGLEADMRSLAGQHHDLPDRHRSLAAALDHSWSLLGEDNRRFLRRLSVFRDGWEADAAAKVADAQPEDLQVLSDKSLIRRDRSGRFGFHALMQQHAQAMLLSADDAHEVQHNHLQYYKGLAEEAGPQLAGPSQVEWLPRLDQEVGNLRQALAWGIAQGETELASLLSLALARYWMIRGTLAEGQQWIESLLNLPQGPSISLRVRLHNRAGILAAMQRHFEQAEAHLLTSVELSRDLGDTQGEVMSLNSLGAMSIERGEYERARSYLESCLPSWRALDNPNGLASTLNNLGAVALLMEDYPAARQRFEESLPLFRDLGDRRMIAGVLYNLGDLSLKEGEIEKARAYLSESLSLRHAIGEVGGVAETLEGFARLAVGDGQAALAAQLFGAAASMRESVGVPHAPVNQGDYDQAVADTRRALGNEAFTQAWSMGSRLTREQVVTLAMNPR
ncbi:MAG: tetratricopeptide repeat protein [Anaerolineales bacterium]|nr:tetratricopeptide repeat protein [Anaerolineales bacterium]